MYKIYLFHAFLAFQERKWILFTLPINWNEMYLFWSILLKCLFLEVKPQAQMFSPIIYKLRMQHLNVIISANVGMKSLLIKKKGVQMHGFRLFFWINQILGRFTQHRMPFLHANDHFDKLLSVQTTHFINMGEVATPEQFCFVS